MKKYSLTSAAFEGEVIFCFNDAGLLESFDSSGAELSEEQQIFMLKKLPRELCEVQRVIGTSPTAKMLEIKQEITFEMFWNRYDEKIRSSKKKSLARWNRFNKSDQAKAYYFIGKYEMSIAQGVAKKYAESYLGAELWNN